MEIKACQSGDAKRKGKIERPFRGLEESFLEELAVLGSPASIGELNERARRWVAERVNGRVHGTTGAVPSHRVEVERRFLAPLPRARFDTAYAEPRRVHVAVPLVAWDDVRYSVPPEALGQMVACRVDVESSELEVCRGPRRCSCPSPTTTWNRPTWPPATGRRRDGHQRVRAAQRRPRLPQAGPGRRVLRHPGRGGGDREVSHVEYLARVVAEQAAVTTNRRLAARLRFARFPYRRSVEDFDFDFQPSVDRKLVEDLATLRFIEERRPLLFLGQPGCGKTHLAVALATRAVEAGYRGYFSGADDMVHALLAARRDGPSPPSCAPTPSRPSLSSTTSASCPSTPRAPGC